jgi:hypothetical protein
MEFKATEEQVWEIMTNAINASSPAGMGFFHFENKDYTVEEVKANLAVDGYGRPQKNEVYADYFAGRMVKLNIRRVSDGVWGMNDEFRDDYQSFCHKYPTPLDLIASVSGVDLV